MAVRRLHWAGGGHGPPVRHAAPARRARRGRARPARGAKVDDALAALGDLAEDLPLVMAVNREYAPGHQVLVAGDELALIPPVSGGDGAVHAAVRAEPLSLDARDRPRARPARRRRGHLPGRDPRRGQARVRGLRRDGGAADGGDRRRGAGAPRPVRRGGRAPGRRRAAVGAVGDRGRLVAPPRRGVRRRARGHRPGQGRGADLEEGDRGRATSAGWRGRPPPRRASAGGGRAPATRSPPRPGPRPRRPAARRALCATEGSPASGARLCGGRSLIDRPPRWVREVPGGWLGRRRPGLEDRGSSRTGAGGTTGCIQGCSAAT